MPTIRNGKQIVETNDLCASCRTGAGANCVFLEAMNLLRVNIEGSGRVISCKGYVALGTTTLSVMQSYEELFETNDEGVL